MTTRSAPDPALVSGASSATSTLVHSGRFVDSTGERSGWLLVDHGSIVAVGGPDQPFAPASRVIDASGRLVVPGFVDMHSHGGGGVHYQDGVEQALQAIAAMRAFGTTRSLASFVSSSMSTIATAIADVRQAMRQDSGLIGVHVEGPFLAPTRKGAHDRELLLVPSPAAIDELLGEHDGIIRQVTIAPELPGGLDAVSRLVDAGVPVAIGHTDCDYDVAREAFARGASIVTHAFNAMPTIEGRAPGVIGAAIEADHVTIEVIADGVHVHPASIRVLFAAAPGRVALVTDAMAAAAGCPGHYQLGSLMVEATEERAVIAGTETLAGSTLTQQRALQVAVNECGIGLTEAIGALGQVPAHALGEQPPSLAIGAPAELVVLDQDLAVVEVLVG